MPDNEQELTAQQQDSLITAWESQSKNALQSQDWGEWLSLQNQLARTYFSLAAYTKAVEVSTAAIHLWQDSLAKPKLQLGSLYLTQGKALKFRLKQKEGLAALEQAQQIFEEQDSLRCPDYAETMFFLGRHYLFVASNPRKATVMFEKALHAGLEIPDFDPKVLAQYYHFLGQASSAMSEHREAIVYYQNALTIRRRELGPNHYYTATSQHSLGNALYHTGQEEKALKSFESCLAIYNQLENPNSSKIESCLNNIAACHDAMGNHKRALAIFQQALAYQHKRYGKDTPRTLISYLNIAISQRNLMQWEAAEKGFLDAIELAKQLDPIDLQHWAKGEQELALLYKMKGDFAGALKYIDASIRTLTRTKPGTPQVLNRTILIVDDIILIESLAFKAQLLFDKPELVGSRSDVMRQVVGILEDYNGLLLNIQENLTSEADKFYLNKEGTNFFSYGVMAAWNLWEAEGDLTHAASALRFMENSRAQLLLASVSESRAKFVADLPPSLLNREDEISQQIAQIRTRLQHLEEEDPALRHQLVRLQLDLQQLSDSIKRAFPAYGRLAEQPPLPTFSEIQSQLVDSSSCLIEYFMYGPKLFGFLILQDTFHFTQIDLPENFVDSARVFADLVTRPFDSRAAKEQYMRLGHELYEHLISPLQEWGPLPYRITIVPDGILNNIPFEALLVQKPQAKNTRYRDLPLMIFTHNITYANSLILLFEQSQKVDRDHNGRSMGFAWSAVREDASSTEIKDRNTLWGALPGTGKELESISRLVAGDFYYGDASRESIFKKGASDYGILHLALHGKATEEEPFLVFPVDSEEEEDGILYLNEMYGMRLRAELAVLSACESGHGKLQQGEGVLSMARGFSYSGIPAIVTNLWEVEDKSAVEIMSRFYTHLCKGQRVDEALHQAKMEYLKNSSNEVASPFFWASFISIGSTGTLNRLEVLPVNEWGYLLVTLGGLLFLGLISLWIVRNRK